ncbi:MAG TPA: hypothetical protein VH309_14470, partial [Elusimicrobiota bacterium]|nr:hypothetical protein [Elusimicrobiota bacterium]
MSKEKDDVLQANEGAPAANIPNLKKKEKERKKAGAAWSGARGAASEFSGATGGTVARAAASAASVAAEGAIVGAEELEGGGLWAAISRFLAGLTSTLLGKMIAAAAAFLLMAAAGLIGYGLLKGKGNASVGAPDLGGITDSMRVREGGSDRFGMAGNSGLRFDPLAASKTAAAPPPTEAKAAAAKPAPDKTADADAQKPVPTGLLAHNLSGAQLSSSLGGDFGSKNIFNGNSLAPKFGAGAVNMPKIGGTKGKLGKMQASTIHATPSARSVGKGSSNKAFGQLRLAKGLSEQGANATSAEQAAAASQGAFDQQQPTGGDLATSGAPGGDTPPAMGGTPPPDTGMPAAPVDPTGGATDPGLEGALSQISQLANQAMSDIQTGTMEAILGGILIGIGAALLFWPMIAVGLALIAAGTALLMMGMSKISQGKQEAQQAIAMGQQLGDSIQNQQQADAINYCTNNAVATGTPVESCTPPENITDANAEATQDQSDIQKVKQI